MPPKLTGSKKSDVWHYFTPQGNQTCICNLCGRIYKTGGGTTNLKNHILYKHPNCTESQSNPNPPRKKKQKLSNSNCTEESASAHAHTDSDADLDSVNDIDLDLDVFEESEDGNSERTIRSPSPVPNHNQRHGSSSSSSTKSGKTSGWSQPTIDVAFKDKRSYEDGSEMIDSSSVVLNQRPGSSNSSTKSIKTSGLIQPTIDVAFKEKRSYESGGSKDASITQALLFMICKDNYPLSCTEKEGFKRFLKVAVPLYNAPSRSTITRRLEEKYISLKKVVSLKLLTADHLALTTDIATVMNATRSFIVLTAHFIDEENTTVTSIALGVKNLTQHHTGDNICQDLREMLDGWSIPREHIVSITTDNGANIVSGVKKLMEGHISDGLDMHVSCFAHNINLVVSKSLGCKEVEVLVQIIDKVKRIVAYFKHSNVAQDELRNEQQKEGKKDGTYLYLIQEIATRWNSTFYCLERFKLLSGHVGKILLSPVHKTAPPMVTPSELGIIEEALILLRPFEPVTKTISGEKYVSGSLVIPLINCVKTALQRVSVSNTNVLCRSLKNELITQIQKRLDPLEKNVLLSSATILDPRFKRIHFSSPLNVASAITVIKNEVRKELRLQGSASPPGNQTEVNNDTQGAAAECDINIWSIHDEVALKNLPDSDSAEGIPTELKLYLNQPIQPRNRDPVQYWTESKFAFPATYKVAMKFLTVLGASVASERLVSILNNICSDSRSRLTPAHTNQLVFLNSLDSVYWDL